MCHSEYCYSLSTERLFYFCICVVLGHFMFGINLQLNDALLREFNIMMNECKFLASYCLIYSFKINLN